MSNFNKTTHDFGELKPRTSTTRPKVTCSFKSKYPIVMATGDCGCTNFRIEDKTLYVDYNVPFLPSDMPEFNIVRHVYATVKIGDEKFTETLVIKATLKK